MNTQFNVIIKGRLAFGTPKSYEMMIDLVSEAEQAVVPALDRGFLFGDSVYEVLWWHRGALIQAREHFDRLRESGRRIYLDVNSGASRVGAVRCRAGAAWPARVAVRHPGAAAGRWAA